LAPTDTVPPATPSSAPVVTGGTGDGLPTVVGQCTEVNSTLILYNGATVLATKSCTTLGANTFTLSTALASGTHSLSYTEKDSAQNESGKSPVYSLVVDRVITLVPVVDRVTSSLPDGSYST